MWFYWWMLRLLWRKYTLRWIGFTKKLTNRNIQLKVLEHNRKEDSENLICTGHNEGYIDRGKHQSNLLDIFMQIEE